MDPPHVGGDRVRLARPVDRLDRRAAHELSRTLEAVVAGRCGLSLDTVVHMTRGFQEYLRRHVAAEQMLLDTLLATAAEDASEPVS